MGDPHELRPEAYLAPLQRLAQRILTDASRAEDAVQEAWLAALRKRPDQQDLAWWLAAAVRRAAFGLRRDEARRREREARAARSEVLPDSTEGAERLEIAGKLVAAVERLEEPYRQAILMRFFEDLPPRAIAKRLQLPVNTVRTHLRRGVEKLHVDLKGSARASSRVDDRDFSLPALAALAGPMPWSVALRQWPRGVQVLGGVLTLTAATGIAVLLLHEERTTSGDRGSWEVSGTASGGTLAPETFPLSSSFVSPGRAETRTRTAAGATWQLNGTVAMEPRSTGGSLPLIVRIFDGEPPTGTPIDQAEFVSNADGSFLGSIPRPDHQAWMTVAADDPSGAYWTRSALVFVPSGETPPEGLLVEASPVDAQVTGVVRDAAGLPVVGARIVASDPMRRLEGGRSTTLSDGHGRFTLDLPSSLPSIDLVAGTADGALTLVEVAALSPGETRTQNLTLAPPRILRGRVRDEANRPVVGAQVRSRWPMDREVTSDGSGAFSIPVPEGMSTQLWIDAPGHAPLRLERFDRVPDLDLVLSKGVALAGRVLDRRGVPVDGVTVRALVRSATVGTAVSDQGGRFALEHLPPERLGLVFLGPNRGVLQTKVDLSHGAADHEADFVLERSRAMEGRVLDPAGNPVGGARLSWQGSPMPSSVGTNAAGFFTLPDVPLTASMLSASCAGRSTGRASITPDSSWVEFTLEPGSFLSGRVLDLSTGEPIQAFTLKVFELDGARDHASSRELEVHSPDGSWSLPWSLPRGTPFAVLVTAAGHAPLAESRLETASAPEFATNLLRLARATELSGQVLGADGQPLEDAHVSFALRSAEGVTLLESGAIPTSANGSFVFRDIPLGAVTLTAWRAGWTRRNSGPIEIQGPNPVRHDIVLERGTSLSGHLLDARGRGLAGERVTAMVDGFAHSTTTGPDGVFRIDNVTPGQGASSIAWERTYPSPPGPLDESTTAPGQGYAPNERPMRSARDLERSILLVDGADIEVELRPRGRSALSGWLSPPTGLPEATLVTLTWIPDEANPYPAPESRTRVAFAANDRFRFAALEPGTYVLQAEVQGPNGMLRGALRVSVPEDSTLDQALALE